MGPATSSPWSEIAILKQGRNDEVDLGGPNDSEVASMRETMADKSILLQYDLVNGLVATQSAGTHCAVDSFYDWWHLKGKYRRNHICLSIALGIAFIVFTAFLLNRSPSNCPGRHKCPCDLIVPDVIHFYRSNKAAENISSKELACVRAALRLHKEVRVHSTYPLKSSQALAAAGLDSPHVIVMYPPRGPGPMHLAILREYGGIFLKNDIYIVSRLDAMRGHDLCSVGDDDIVAGTTEGAISSFPVKLKGVLLDRDYGALYIGDIMKNCTYSAVRLDTR